MPNAHGASVEELLERGLEHYVEGRLKPAVAEWQNALRLDPDNRRAREYLKSALQEHGPLQTRRGEFAQAASGATGWDDGPSAAPAITLELPPIDHSQSVLGALPAEDDPPSTSSRRQVAALFTEASERHALGDFSGALSRLEQLLALEPGHVEAVAMRDDCTATLVQMYESQLGHLDRCPRLMVNSDEIVWLNLDHRAGFVLAQVDGRVTFDELYSICGMSRLDTARILAQLLSEKVIG